MNRYGRSTNCLLASSVFALAWFSLAFGAFGGSMEIDLSSRLSCTRQLSTAIESHIPLALAAELANKEEYDPSTSLDAFFSIARYRPRDRDSSSALVLVYCTDAWQKAALLLFHEQEDSSYVFLSQDTTVSGGQLAVMRFLDLDCDGRNEILVDKAQGMAAWTDIDVVKIEYNLLRNVSKEWFGSQIHGKNIEFVTDSTGCSSTVELDIEGADRGVMVAHKTYRFDARAKTFKLIGSDTPQSQQPEKR